MTDLLEQVKDALEAGEPFCTACGHKRSEHHYRHRLKPTTTRQEAVMADIVGSTCYSAGYRFSVEHYCHNPRS